MDEKEILDLLHTKRFADSYADTGIIGRYITGDVPAVSKDEVLAEIKKLFKIP